MAGTLPDVDVLIDHGDAIRNMVLHRAETHAPSWLSLFSLPFALAVARMWGELLPPPTRCCAKPAGRALQ